MTHLLNWSAVQPETWKDLLDRSLWWSRADSRTNTAGKGKSIALMFFNDSLRTRASMELAAAQLGAYSTTISPGAGSWNFEFKDGDRMLGEAAEHIQEAIGVLSSMFDSIGVRLFASGTDYDADRSERLLRRIIHASTVPVINLESAFYHPCQALADATVLSDHFHGDVTGRKFVLSWVQHPHALPMAVPNSTLLMAARLGMNITIARPDSHCLDPEILSEARTLAAVHGQEVHETTSIEEAAVGAHVIYAKAWGGKLAYDAPEMEKTIRDGLNNWRIGQHHMNTTDRGVFMHCLPVRRNVVVDDEVLDSAAAIHLRQAKCRLSAQKAILEHVWSSSGVPSVDVAAHGIPQEEEVCL